MILLFTFVAVVFTSLVITVLSMMVIHLLSNNLMSPYELRRFIREGLNGSVFLAIGAASFWGLVFIASNN